MDAQSADSDLQPAPKSWWAWLARERESGRFYRWATIGTAVVLAAILIALVPILIRSGEPGSLLSPPLIALSLVAILIPSIVNPTIVNCRSSIANRQSALTSC